MADYIVNVIEGPFHSSQIPDWDDRDDGFGFPYGEAFVLVVAMRDERGVIRIEELLYEDLDSALEVVEHFCQQIIPLPWNEVM